MLKSKKMPEELVNMSVDDLVRLSDRIDKLLTTRVEAERKVLLKKLETIHGFEMRQKSKLEKPTRRHNERAKPAPKYRNPITGETWTGRGLLPRWMRKAIEAGHTKDEFLI